MKINNFAHDHAVGHMRGRNLGPRAAPGAVSVTDGTTDVAGVAEFVFPAGMVSELADGVAQIGVGAMLQTVTNNSGVALVAGDVVVIDTSGNIVTTTTAQDTRPVGIVMAPIAAAATGPIAFSGYVPLVHVTASVTAGEFAETSTTAKDATQSAVRRTGSFGYFVTGGTSPAVILFGIPDSTSASVSGDFETTTEGGGSVVKAHGAAGSTETIDPTDGNVHTLTLDANLTLTLNPPASSSRGSLLEIRATQDGTGGRTITWPGSVSWIGTTPVPATTAGSTAVYLLETLDNGSSYLAVMVGGVAGFATPAIVLGSSAAAGSASTTIRSDATIAAFDATSPSTQAIGDSAVVGTAAFAARRDHKHAMPAFGSPVAVGTANSDGVATTLPRSDHVHAGATTSGAHAHVVSETHLSNGSTGLYTLDEFYESGSVSAWNTTTLARLTVTETEPDQATVSPVGTSGDAITFDYAATLA